MTALPPGCLADFRFPFDPADARFRAAGFSTVEVIARRVGSDRRTVYRWYVVGLTEKRADAVAVVLGTTVAELWPAEWAAYCRLADEVEQEKGRRREAAAKARWRARRAPEKRDAELAYLAAYRERYREALNAERRARYRRNREAEIRYAVDYKKRKRQEATG